MRTLAKVLVSITMIPGFLVGVCTGLLVAGYVGGRRLVLVTIQEVLGHDRQS